MAGPIRIAILANGSQARREIGQVQTSLGKFSTFAKRAAGVAGIGALAVGTAAFVKSSVDAERQFSTTMRLIQASTKASSTELDRLNDLAIKLGADTSFSAQEAAGAMLELAKAGLDTKTIMGGGLSGTLTLAAAGGLELEAATTIAANALNTFNLQGKDMANVAAALAGGANASTASVESLGGALQQVGPGATNAGLSLNETVAALSAFDAAGIKGSDAGTSLKTMLARLVPSTQRASDAMAKYNLDFTDAQGNFLSLTQISGQLQRSLSGLSEEERSRALTTIFGSDATRAATVLMKEGAGGIRNYIKATQDSNAAQEMAEARLSGTEGALERLSGSIETAKLRLGQELAPAIERGADLLATNFVPAMEAGIEVGKKIGRAVAPVAKEIAETFSDLAGSADEAGGIFEDVLLPALETASDVLASVLGLINDLPGPVKQLAVEAGVAALVLPRLTAGLTAVSGTATTAIARVRQLNAELSNGATRSASMASGMGRLGGLAKQAAGIGGILALTSGLSDATTEGLSFSGVMKSAAGGAGIGAMFGPVGALVGAGAGAGLGALVGAFSDAADGAKKTRLELLRTEGFKQAKADAESLRESLRGVVNAYGQIPRAAIEASFTGEDGKLDADIAQLRELKVSMDTIVSATMGQADAQRIVNDALTRGLAPATDSLATLKARYEDAKDGAIDLVTATGEVYKNAQQVDDATLANYKKEYEDARTGVENLKGAQDTFGERIRQNTGEILAHADQVRGLAADLGITVKEYQKFPKAVRTRVEGQGLPQTRDDAVRLIRQYKGLQNYRHIKAVVSAPGVKLTGNQIKDLKKRYDLTPKQVRTLMKLEGVSNARTTLRGWLKGIETSVKSGASISDREAKVILKKLKGIEDAHPNMSGYVSDVRRAVQNARGEAGGASGVGNALKTGLLSGMYGTGSALSAIMTAAVRQAIADARREAGAKSPSKKTEALGRDMATGLDLGMAKGKDKNKKSGRDMVLALLAGVTAGASGVGGSLDKITNLIEKRVDLKDDKKERARERAILKHLGKQYDALRRNGKAQDANNKKLDAAKAKLATLQDFVTGVRDSFLQFGNITQLGQAEDGTVASGDLLQQLRDRANSAERFADLIRSLEGKLNKASLQQLIDAGPEAGLATAEALASGGQVAVDEINALTARMQAAGVGLGRDLTDTMFGVGIKAQEGIVAGLEARSKELDRAAKRMAKTLAEAVKKALGIKSPSRVFRGIGDDVVKGLGIGLDETYVRRQGVTLADSLQSGFATPALDAQVSPGAATAQAVRMRVHLTADQASHLQRGREIVADVDAYLDNGGRSRHLGKR